MEEYKKALLDFIQEVLQEIEEEAAISHGEKYALLEDALNSATDKSELRLAFEQWCNDNDDIGLGYSPEDIWDLSINQLNDL